MIKVSDVLNAMESLAPVERKMDFDNVGLLVGNIDNTVEKIIVALDITDNVIEEACKEKAQLIVSHHPVFFQLKSVTAQDILGRKVLNLAANGISAICMHTNLDVSVGGVNDALANAIGIENTKPMSETGVGEDGIAYGFGRYGTVERQPISHFLSTISKALCTNGIRYADAGKEVCRVAVNSGAGGSEFLRAVELGCDTFVSGDLKYNQFLDALEIGINLIDAGHFPTEDVVIGPIVEYLARKFPQIKISKSEAHAQPEKFFI